MLKKKNKIKKKNNINNLDKNRELLKKFLFVQEKINKLEMYKANQQVYREVII